MTPEHTLQSAQYRVVQYYLARLRQAETASRRGRENRAYWLKLIQQDWEQIKQWQAWSALGKDSDVERARLCATFPIMTSDILRARQTPSETLVWVQQALEAARKLDDDDAERDLLYQLGQAYLNLESLDLAEQSAQQLMAHTQTVNDELNEGRAWYIMGASNLLRGQYNAAEEYLKNSIDILIAHRADDETARAWRVFGRIALYRGDYQKAYEYHVRYFDMVAASGNIRELGVACIALCGAHSFLRNFQAAEDFASRALEIAHSNGFPRMIPAALLSLADTEKELGKFDSAASHYEEGVTAARSISPPSTVITGLYGLGQIRSLQGDTDQALAHFEEAMRLAREAPLLFRICEVAHNMVLLHLTRNEFDRACVRLYEMVSSAKQLNTPHFMARALGVAVILWQRWEKHEQAAEWSGLLKHYSQHLDSTLLNTRVNEQLEAELGTEHYRRALEKGNALTLEEALSAVLHLLN